MPAVKSVGAYIPYYRLNREEIGRAWGGFPQTGEKAVANFNEDSITLSVEAARDCLKGIDNKKIDGLYFASSTAPFQEMSLIWAVESPNHLATKPCAVS